MFETQQESPKWRKVLQLQWAFQAAHQRCYPLALKPWLLIRSNAIA